MIPPELMRRIRHIQIRAKRVVTEAMSGEYLSVFKGRGLEFEEVREYAPGDDIRTIDWNVTARAGMPFVKEYREERQLTVIFLVDLSASGSFGSRSTTKVDCAAEICALIALSAVRNNDRVGLILFTDEVERYVPPLKGQRHVLRMIRELLAFEPSGRRTDLRVALEFLSRVVPRRAAVFIISDFIDEGYERLFSIVARKHDLNAIDVADPHELDLPNVGLIALEDAESGERRLVDSSSEHIRREWNRRWAARRTALQGLCRRAGAGYVGVSTGEEYLDSIVRFFDRRRRERSLAL